MTAQHWIDGRPTGSARTSNTTDPATGEVIGTYSDADAEVGQAAIDAADRTFRSSPWRHDAMVRATALSHLADAWTTRMDDVVDTLCRENGKLRGEAAFEAHFIVRALRFASGLALQTFGRVSDTAPGRQAMSIRQPVGVAGLIVPWNSPAYLSIRALAPALAAGCTAVVKMPGQAAQSAAVMAEILASVPEPPAGAVNIVVESGSEVARLLVDSPQVPVISFTGSTATGKLIAQAAAARFKRVGLELGGKTPHLVFADADLDLVVPTVAASSTVFAGQFCMTGSRVIVQREIADEFIERLALRLEAVQPGPASDPASEIGPMIDKASVARVDAAVRRRSPRARRRSSGADRPPTRNFPAVPSTAPRSYRSPIPRCPSCKRRPSGRCRPCRSSTPRRRPSRWPTTPSTGSAPASGAGTSTGRCAWPGSWTRA